MNLKKLLRYWLTYEVAVTGYNFAQSKIPSLPAVPLPSLLSRLLAPMLTAGASVAGKQIITPDGTQSTLPAGAMLSNNGQTIIAGSYTYPVISMASNGVYYVDNPGQVMVGDTIPLGSGT
jgi:hypothetical protein